MTTATIEEQCDFDKLEFIRLKFPRLLPLELIESVKGRTFTPEQFLAYQDQQAKVNNPNNLLFALICPEKKIHGYLWAELSALDRSLFVNTFSISKGFWHKGKSIPKVVAFLHEVGKKLKVSNYYWITTNEKFFCKHGFKRSKNCLMEYDSK